VRDPVRPSLASRHVVKATDLRAAIIGATPDDALGIVFDLSNVVYIDSAGFHLLYRLGESVRQRGQTLRW
jgi:anti-anti-sigma regulatory factor